MLKIHIPAGTLYKPDTRELVPISEHELKLEHSLVSVSLWEEKWHVPYLSDTERTQEQTLDYIRCMNEDPDISTDVLLLLTDDDFTKITNYIKDPHSATVIPDDGKPKKKHPDPVTSEEIYSNMTVLRIPYECQHWNLNRLINLIDLTNRKNTPPKKKSNKERISEWDKINDQRRKKYSSKG